MDVKNVTFYEGSIYKIRCEYNPRRDNSIYYLHNQDGVIHRVTKGYQKCDETIYESTGQKKYHAYYKRGAALEVKVEDNYLVEFSYAKNGYNNSKFMTAIFSTMMALLALKCR